MKRNMRCKRLCFIYSLVISLVALASSAPSEKRARGLKKSIKIDNGNVKLKQFLQAEPTNSGNNNKGEDPQWYPTVDLTAGEVNDLDYPSEAEAEANQKAKAAIKAKENKKVDEKKEKDTKDGKSSFKTICEDESKDGNCLRSKSISKQSATANAQSLDVLFARIRETVDKHDSLDKNELKSLREDVSNLGKSIAELQQNLKTGCVDAGNSQQSGMGEGNVKETSVVKDYTGDNSNLQRTRTGGQGHIAEIVEEHTVERKIVKAKDHQESKKITSDVETLVEKGQATTKAPAKTVPTTKLETVEITSPPVPAPRVEITEPTRESAPNYLNMAADINYNGGINRSMDSLKQQYPDGYWPDNLKDDDDEKEAGSKDDTEMGNLDDAYYEDDGEKEAEGGGSEDLKEEDFYTTDPTLSPEYLEKIILQERGLAKGIGKLTSSVHHVQEHNLPNRP